MRRNGAFFVFMFVLGWLCVQIEVPPHIRTARPYPLAAQELYVDLFVIGCVLALLPIIVRRIVRGLLYVLFYGVALIDMFCFVRFESALTPTMLMLASETTGQETREFLSGYLSWDIIWSPVGWILLLMLAHVLWTVLRMAIRRLRKRMILPKVNERFVKGGRLLFRLAAVVLFGYCLWECYPNKVAMQRLFSYKTIGQVEHELTRKDRAQLYLPIYRLCFSTFANSLASEQVNQLIAASDKVRVDSCSYRVPEIVLIIGESYNKHHSQLYGYQKPTTPRQLELQRDSSLVAFSDVVAPWNLTSFVFKYMLSLYALGDEGEWCDRPLFPEVFRSAGYHVTFITNQFQSHATEEVFDFSGGFFLNDPKLSQLQFDTRNHTLHRWDDGVLTELDTLRKQSPTRNLTILHLMGQHVDYRARYPMKTRTYFRPSNYNRPELTARQLAILSQYDNSLRYNDSIVYEVTRRYMDRDALVIYMPDHGEEIFDGSPYMYGRMHSADIDYRLARNEFEIPFWIWGSPLYRERHPYGWKAIREAQHRPLMIDALPHLLLYLGGISTPDYRADLNVISPEYNEKRPRLLKATTDYNKLVKSEK